MQIHKKEYDVSPKKLLGYRKIEESTKSHLEEAQIIRFVVELDESQYYINSDDEPEMTEEAQKEYDDFVSNISDYLDSKLLDVIDEGNGEGDEELDYHITAVIGSESDEESSCQALELQVVARV